MKAKRRKFTAAFKAKVAIEALKERRTLAELTKEFELAPNMITAWKREFLERSAVVFETEPPKTDFDEERERLFAKIGKLEVERDWLKKISVKAGLSVKE
jgi:transposase